MTAAPVIQASLFQNTNLFPASSLYLDWVFEVLSYSNHNSAINLDNKVKLHFIQFTEVAHKNSDFHKYLTTNAKCGECNNVNESLALVYSHKL